MNNVVRVMKNGLLLHEGHQKKFDELRSIVHLIQMLPKWKQYAH